MSFVRKLYGVVFLFAAAGTLVAQAVPSTAVTADRLAQMQQQIADAKGSADNAWMLVCTALVLLMTGPGLALFYGGLVRKKNVLATMMQAFAMMALITVRMGDCRLQPLLSPPATVSSAAWSTLSCTAWAQRLMRITPPPSRSRPS